METNHAAVIGDVVRSRQYPDRAVLQNAVQNTLARVNEQVVSSQTLRMTIGDEFQGLYSSLPQAILATLLVRLGLLAVKAEARFGIGWGTIPIHDPDSIPFGQDGPAWWNARAALSRISESEKQQRWPRTWRTAVNTASSEYDTIVNAFLLCRDDLVYRMDMKDIAIALETLRGTSQERISDQLSMTQSAVAQRLHSHGIYTILRAHDELSNQALL